MRGLTIVCVLSVAHVASAWSWPWQKRTTTTTTTPTPLHGFEQGVAAALGLEDVSACSGDVGTSFSELKEGWADYKQGGIIKKAEALVKLAEGVQEIIKSLGDCAKVAQKGSKFVAFLAELRDPRFYTVHNALTLSLNLAEDRGQLSAFAKGWEQRNFFLAGQTMTTTILDVLGAAGIPGSNGTSAEQIAAGLAEGFATTFDIKCFHDVRIEASSLAGGLLDVHNGTMVVQGLQSLAHGLAGLVPTIKECFAERHEIAELLKEVADFRHPADLAKKWAQNIKDHGLDIALETASAIMAYKGAEWHHFGKMIGEILEKVVVIRPAVTVVV